MNRCGAMILLIILVGFGGRVMTLLNIIANGFNFRLIRIEPIVLISLLLTPKKQQFSHTFLSKRGSKE